MVARERGTVPYQRVEHPRLHRASGPQQHAADGRHGQSGQN